MSSEETTQPQVAAASQWRLIWIRFRKNRAAVASGMVLVVLYLSVLFAELVAPYSANTRFIRHNFCPPQRLRWRGPDGFHMFERWRTTRGWLPSRHLPW